MLLFLLNSGRQSLRTRFVLEILLCCFILLTNPAPSSFSEKPPAPSLSLFSPASPVVDYGVFYSVFEGHPFVVTCRSDSPQRVLSFNLSANGIYVLPAVDNAAHFSFPDADLKQGKSWTISCVYNFDTNLEVKSSKAVIMISIIQPSYVRLAGGESRCLGRLELEHEGEWRPVSQQLWGLKEAAVVCRQLNCGSVISTDTQSRELQPVWRFFSDCDGSEKALLGCGSVMAGQSASAVSVLCSDSHDLLLDDGLQRNDGTKACSGKLLLRDRTSQMKMVTAGTSGWDKRHASIVCRQLGCGNKAVSTSKMELPHVTPMWRFYSDCDGSESALLQCGHVRQWFSSKAIEVVCEG